MKTLTKTFFSIGLLAFILLIGSTKLMAQPVNDLIENAIDLAQGPIPFLDADVDFPSATNLGDQTPGPFCEVTDPGVWYSFKATAIGIVSAEVLNPNDSFVIFFSGPENATSGQQLLFVDQPTNICNINPLSSIETSIGTIYYLYVSNNPVSDIEINAIGAFASPENDLLENAINLNGLEDYNDPDVHFLMATPTNDNGMSGCDGGVSAVWYKFTAAMDGQVIAGIGNPADKCAIIFYEAPDENVSSGTELTYVNQPSNICGLNNLSSIMATAGTSYYILATSLLPYGTVSINLSGILSVSENTFDGFKYYPNPVKNEINLSAKTTVDEVSIFNMVGQKVYSQKINTTNKSIDLSNLQSGMYVMRVIAEGNTATYKIVKQ